MGGVRADLAVFRYRRGEKSRKGLRPPRPPPALSNLKHVDFVYQTHSGGSGSLRVSRETTLNSLISNASTYATHLKPYTMRNQAVNFQTEISKACSD